MLLTNKNIISLALSHGIPALAVNRDIQEHIIQIIFCERRQNLPLEITVQETSKGKPDTEVLCHGYNSC
jgi:hypothetical protein